MKEGNFLGRVVLNELSQLETIGIKKNKFVYVFYLDISTISGNTDEHFRSIVSEERNKRIDKLVKASDKKRTLYMDILRRYAIRQVFQQLEVPLNILKTTYGKPYIPQTADCHFNCSDSHHYVVCAVSNFPVGIDIEFNDDTFKDAHSFLTPEEIALTKNYTLSNFDLWCAKESYLKCLGIGLCKGLSFFSVECVKNKLYIADETNEKRTIKIEKIKLSNDYSCCLCCEDGSMIKMVGVTDNDLLGR